MQKQAPKPRWMSDNALTFMRVNEYFCSKRRATVVTQCDLVHADGTLLYQGVKASEEKALGVQKEVGAMAWAIQCNTDVINPH
ncbi:hypothetical protein [Undibacterium crateris]|uniref:hypothetical protein n=1 Tax=Undibacterium crateris TaxID=2528175 RepID=UPI00138A6B7B|nr:hypothetical protein [Undibacterium crateris]NDI85067.1 hypothetical protein [Undibacterium crateris]